MNKDNDTQLATLIALGQQVVNGNSHAIGAFKETMQGMLAENPGLAKEVTALQNFRANMPEQGLATGVEKHVPHHEQPATELPANRKKLAVVCDFDETYTRFDTLDAYLEERGVDTKAWKQRMGELQKEGYHANPAFVKSLVELNEKAPEGQKITKQSLQEFAQKVQYFKGVETFFDRVREQAASKGLEVEFHLISGGMAEMIRESPVAKQCKTVNASEFAFNEKGELVGAKRPVDYTAKTRILNEIHKGIVEESRTNAFLVNDRVADDQASVRFENMVIAGDGLTDSAMFAYGKTMGATTIGVRNPALANQSRALGLVKNDRVDHLVPGDYTRGSAMEQVVFGKIDQIARTNAELETSMQQGGKQQQQTRETTPSKSFPGVDRSAGTQSKDGRSTSVQAEM